MAGDGSRVRVGLSRSTNDGPGKASTTLLPMASDAHVMGFSEICVNLPFLVSAGYVRADVAVIHVEKMSASSASTARWRRGWSSTNSIWSPRFRWW